MYEDVSHKMLHKC